MNRRDFLKNLFATVIVSQVNIENLINTTLEKTALLQDDEFIMYITLCFNMHVNNPSHCGIITGITGE